MALSFPPLTVSIQYGSISLPPTTLSIQKVWQSSRGTPCILHCAHALARMKVYSRAVLRCTVFGALCAAAAYFLQFYACRRSLATVAVALAVAVAVAAFAVAPPPLSVAAAAIARRCLWPLGRLRLSLLSRQLINLLLQSPLLLL